MTPKFHSLRVSEVKQETEDSVSIAFEIPTDLSNDYQYVPGQYLTLKTFFSGEEVRRSYSLCTAPFEKEWRVAVKKVENGLFSTFANEELKAGDVLEVMTPMGKFTTDISKTNSKFYAFFAAGSGITPVLSLIKSILKEEPKSRVILFYGNKNFGSILFREEIEALKNTYINQLQIVHILSRESLGNKLQKGRIDAEKSQDLFKAFLKDETVDEVFVCGPEEMIHSVKETCISSGIDEKHVHFELFGTYTKPKEITPLDEDEVAAKVRIILDGDELDIRLRSTGINILDAAQNAGADLPFACKGGVCCTCKARVLEGSVRMDVNYALETDEVEAGYILTCQSHPTSENVVISFDE
ncbi:MAG: phenylacetate-CoA oxygenase/reductase subunit PaaK [Bacteroidetes bacterium]|nr:phenylacetate-CoA oxygenase/reductase subunit PaaK [Bacteroidota bacterium]